MRDKFRWKWAKPYKDFCPTVVVASVRHSAREQRGKSQKRACYFLCCRCHCSTDVSSCRKRLSLSLSLSLSSPELPDGTLTFTGIGYEAAGLLMSVEEPPCTWLTVHLVELPVSVFVTATAAEAVYYSGNRGVSLYVFQRETCRTWPRLGTRTVVRFWTTYVNHAESVLSAWFETRCIYVAFRALSRSFVPVPSKFVPLTLPNYGSSPKRYRNGSARELILPTVCETVLAV